MARIKVSLRNSSSGYEDCRYLECASSVQKITWKNQDSDNTIDYTDPQRIIIQHSAKEHTSVISLTKDNGIIKIHSKWGDLTVPVTVFAYCYSERGFYIGYDTGEQIILQIEFLKE